MTSGDVPDAIAAIVAGVIADHPYAPPQRLGQLIVRELEAQGWVIRAPEGRGSEPLPGRS